MDRALRDVKRAVDRLEGAAAARDWKGDTAGHRRAAKKGWRPYKSALRRTGGKRRRR